MAMVLRLDAASARRFGGGIARGGALATCPEIHNLLGVICSEMGRHAEAASHFERALELDPSDEAAKVNLAASRRQAAGGP